MRNIYDCVDAFFPLLDTEYEIILGRKDVSTALNIGFDKRDCYHLMGLQYLVDRPELNRDRGKILPLLEELLDNNETVFKYNQKANCFSMIQANYLMKNHIEGRNLFLFLSLNKDNKYFCRSFFPQDQKDYTQNQASWTLLYKKKKYISTGKEVILYNHLKNDNSF
ncbi:MAG: PBECR4 domain-containing protein [Lachnospiraceae bacterium]|nr:PBECR4 domain-containing protein [Lachnospiraceae bacterium]